jgi:hypothetical protein
MDPNGSPTICAKAEVVDVSITAITAKRVSFVVIMHLS